MSCNPIKQKEDKNLVESETAFVSDIKNIILEESKGPEKNYSLIFRIFRTNQYQDNSAALNETNCFPGFYEQKNMPFPDCFYSCQ